MGKSQFFPNDDYSQSVLIIASSFGHTLIFQTLDDFERFVQQVSGMLEWVKEEGVDPPFLFHQGDGRIPVEELDQWTDWLKWTIAQGITDG